jgi:hypothetical protein
MATEKFTFTTLTGSETAGWQSINTLISSIDAQLYAKGAGIADGGTVVGQLLRWNGTTWVPGTVGASSIDNNSVELGTKTTGSYIRTLSGSANQVSVSANDVESADVTVGLVNNTALPGTPTVETAPVFNSESIVNDNKVVDRTYVNDALSFATTGGVSLSGDVTGLTNANIIADDAVTAAKLRDSVGTDSDRAVTTNHIRNSAVTSDKINNGSVTYDKLATDIKTYSVTASGGSNVAGVYFVTNGNLTSDSLSSSNSQSPFVIANSASNITLTLPSGVGSAGDTIIICRYGSGAVTIDPSSVTINGSTSVTYSILAQYSVASLVCISSNVWIIAGDI